jgi:ArsR family transcriptional regulator, arsenate/arsenite/antimonite-responsive transcriptional repressor
MDHVNLEPLDAELAALAKAAAHPVRVRILRLLAGQESRQCCDIVGALQLAQSTVSEHLRILKTAGLVRGRECRGRVAYCIVPEALDRMKRLFSEI